VSISLENPPGANVCVAYLSGDVDIASVGEFRAALEVSIATGCSTVVLDLADVDYADSSALGLLVWIERRLAPLGGRLVLTGADRNVSRILELSGLVAAVPRISTADDVATALVAVDITPLASSPEWVRELSVPATIENMAGLRAQVCGLIVGLGLTEAMLFDTKVAVGEALANAARHGSPGGPEDEVRVTVSAYPDRIEIVVHDEGRGFDGESASGPDVYASGGRGVLFMRALMDRVVFEGGPDRGTVVTLTKRRPPAVRPEGLQETDG
jgi:anti-anti-sigma factor